MAALRENRIKVIRIGIHKPDAARPLKVIFFSEAVKQEVFYRYLDANNTAPRSLNRVIISLDRTKKQNEEYKELKKTLEAREANGEKNLKIRRGKIVATTSMPGSSFRN